jgi:hypothetical protein
LREETILGRSISLEIAEGRYGYYKAGILVLIIYLSVFSNSFTNIILAVYSGTHVLRNIQRKKNFKEYFIHIGIISAWVIAVIFQMFDSRNDNARSQGMQGNMSGAVKGYLSNLTSINKMAMLILALIVIAFIVVTAIKRKQDGSVDVKKKALYGSLLETVLSFVLISVYLILLCGVASPGYITRTDVKIGIFFYLFVAVAVMMGYLLGDTDGDAKTISFIGKTTRMLLPLIAFILISQTLNYCKSYRDYNLSQMPFEQELVIGRDLIAQFEKADRDGFEEFDLHVLLNDTAGDNWPYPDYSGNLIGDALFRHGVIARPIAAHTVFDENKNTELGMK